MIIHVDPVLVCEVAAKAFGRDRKAKKTEFRRVQAMGEFTDIPAENLDPSIKLVNIGSGSVFLVGYTGIDALRLNAYQGCLLPDMIVKLARDAAPFFLLGGDKAPAELPKRAFRLPNLRYV